MDNKITHLLDYPPRGTACGLYWPEKFLTKGFGTYFNADVTCKKCLAWIRKRRNG